MVPETFTAITSVGVLVDIGDGIGGQTKDIFMNNIGHTVFSEQEKNKQQYSPHNSLPTYNSKWTSTHNFRQPRQT